ncbi:hypothetical protein C8R43DRAFT_1207581 [Mycena crocata]|nr:hypothetical protein C8R43DRAFT_1207581 [Mycena crocata]
MEETEDIPNARPKRVLIIGGGPSGLVTLRNLRDRGDFDDVQLVERRDDVGGVWYLDEGAGKTGPRWPSPAYPGLIGNVLPKFLSFSGFPAFSEPPSTSTGQPFPSLSETHTYLRAFAAPLLSEGVIRLSTEVCAVEELPRRAGWRVGMRRWGNSAVPEELEETWDAVVVAVAFYDHPVFPTTPGVDRLRELNLAHHAQGWRGPKGYESKRILVIGNANSGNDIAAQLAPVALSVYQSIRRPNFPGFPSLPDPRIARVAPVLDYAVHSGGEAKYVVDARLTDGTTIPDLDAVIFATGYRPFPDFVRVRPFFNQISDGLNHDADSVPTQASDDALIPLVTPVLDPTHPAPTIPHLHRYMLYVHNPALAFVGTAFASYTPFTIADVCSTWLSLAWSGALSYPTALPALLEFEGERLEAVREGRAEMEAASVGSGAAATEQAVEVATEQEVVEGEGGTKQRKTEASALVSYGVLGPFEEPYAAALRAEIVAVRPELDKVLSVWSPEQTAARDAMFPVKLRALEIAREREDGLAAVRRGRRSSEGNRSHI